MINLSEGTDLEKIFVRSLSEDHTLYPQPYASMVSTHKPMRAGWHRPLWVATTVYETANCFGDPQQCELVESSSQIKYDYLDSKTVREMCPRVKTLKYIEKSCRYDTQTHEMLKTFLKHGKVSKYFQPTDKKNYKNIRYLNSTRKEANRDCCNQFTKGKRYETVIFKYNNEKETYKVCQDMSVLATRNIKEKDIFNTMEFKIEEIKGNTFKVNIEWFDEYVFRVLHPSFLCNRL